MSAVDSITVDVVAKVRCTHKVLNAHSSFYRENLQNACTEAQNSGMMLVNVIKAGRDYVVLVFIGDEEVGNDAGEEQEGDASADAG